MVTVLIQYDSAARYYDLAVIIKAISLLTGTAWGLREELRLGKTTQIGDYIRKLQVGCLIFVVVASSVTVG